MLELVSADSASSASSDGGPLALVTVRVCNEHLDAGGHSQFNGALKIDIIRDDKTASQPLTAGTRAGARSDTAEGSTHHELALAPLSYRVRWQRFKGCSSSSAA